MEQIFWSIFFWKGNELFNPKGRKLNFTLLNIHSINHVDVNIHILIIYIYNLFFSFSSSMTSLTI